MTGYETPLGSALVTAYRQVEREALAATERHLGPVLAHRRPTDQA